jgi:hypothetical protein
MKKFLLGAFALTLLTVTSCKKKDSEPANVTPTTANLSGAYTSSKITTTSPGSTTETDITNSVLTACEKDDVTTLNSNGTWVLTDAGTQCSPPSADNGTWSLVNSTTINLDGDNYTIKRFNGTNLDVYITDPTYGTITQYLVKH